MHLDVVAVLVVFCIAFTVSVRSDPSNNEFLPQPIRHMKRHHRHEEKHVVKTRERNRTNPNNRHPNNNISNKNGNRKRKNNQWSTPRHGNQPPFNSGGSDVFVSRLNNNNHNNRNGGEIIQGGGGSQVFECCPSETRMVEMVYGVSRNNTLLEIYNNASKPQRFYEVVCAPNVINRTCKFVEAALQPNSRCVERFTYTYALVRDFPITNNDPSFVHRADSSEWRLDYIRIRSGCFCEINKSTNR
ncbi:hypothetical protein CHUAL_000618 [Chamberlinius hualienensis]